MLRRALRIGPFLVLSLAMLVIAVVVSQHDSSNTGEPDPDLAPITVIREKVIVAGTPTSD